MPTQAQTLYDDIVASGGQITAEVNSLAYNLAQMNPSSFIITPYFGDANRVFITVKSNSNVLVSSFPGVSTFNTVTGAAGLSSTDIRTIQNALNSLPSSLPRLSVDGIAGAKTTQRVQEYQRLKGYAATGTLDAVTRASILSDAAGRTPSVANNNTPNILPSALPPSPSQGFNIPSSYIVLGIVGLIAVVILSE